MDPITFKPFSFVAPTLILFSISVLFLPSVKSSSDYSSLVYTKCSNQTYTDSPESHSQTLSTLFQQLLSKSHHSKFSKATAGDVRLGISGLFQCRGDLRDHECQTCVNTLPEASNGLCKGSVAGRVQLSGCYFHYETDGFSDEGHEHGLLHRTCSEKKAVGGGFGEVREAAFLAVESEMVSNGGGFYEGDYENVHIVGQCEGDLGTCDCGECISFAGQIAEEQCGDSISAQIYLEKCSLSYSCSLYGIPGNPYPEEEDPKRNAGKTVAIVLGGAAVLFGGLILLGFIKSCRKKDDI